MANAEKSILLLMLDQAFDHQSWHGTNLKGAIRGIGLEEAAWRPQPDRHNIWEIVVHAAYWKYAAKRRLLSEPRGSFALNGSNWFPRPEEGETNESSWKSDVALLVETHRTLRATVATLDPATLHETRPGSKFSYLELITGVGAHDLYHAGQIQLIKKLYANAG